MKNFQELWNIYEIFPQDVINKIILSIYDSWFPCDPKKTIPSNCLKRWIENIYQYGNIRHCESDRCHTIGINNTETFSKCLNCKKIVCSWSCKQPYIRLCRKCYSMNKYGIQCERCKNIILLLTHNNLPRIQLDSCKYCNKILCKQCFKEVVEWGGCYDCYLNRRGLFKITIKRQIQ